MDVGRYNEAVIAENSAVRVAFKMLPPHLRRDYLRDLSWGKERIGIYETWRAEKEAKHRHAMETIAEIDAELL